jgi:uncharacterized protein
MNKQEVIDSAIDFVKKELENAEGGHDWFHIERVWKNAKYIAAQEAADIFIVEMAALLHDIADAKFNDGDEEAGPAKAKLFLEEGKVDRSNTDRIIEIIRHISFKGGNFSPRHYSEELAIVQDADRLDAIGAIGIARAFNYGGFTNRKIYDPSIPPDLNMSKDVYKRSKAPTINHFYEKLLLLKDRMNTETGKKMALQRHEFMQNYLTQFYQEWNTEI